MASNWAPSSEQLPERDAVAGPRRHPPSRHFRAVQRRTPGHSRRSAEGPLERLRLPLPPALRLRAPHRPGPGPRARRRAHPGTRGGRQGRRRRPPPRDAVLPPAGRPRHRAVLRRLPLRRILDRRPPHPGRVQGPSRPGHRGHQRTRTRHHQERRRPRNRRDLHPAGAEGGREHRRPRGHRPLQHRQGPGEPGPGHPGRPRREALRGPLRTAPAQGRVGNRADEDRRRRHRAGIHRGRQGPAAGAHPPARRARRRRRVLRARPGGRQRTRLRHHRGLRQQRHACCTGPGTPARSTPASCCCSTPVSRRTRSTPRTSPAPCRPPARSPTIQRKVYEAVLDAADAGFAAAQPGTKFRDIHTAPRPRCWRSGWPTGASCRSPWRRP